MNGRSENLFIEINGWNGPKVGFVFGKLEFENRVGLKKGFGRNFRGGFGGF